MIALGLNVILGVMLFCGLVLGLRLEQRLRRLKDSHADFAKAVSELDGAALRTEDSLAQLRAGTESARVDLAARIDQARMMVQRLEALNAAAEKTLNEPLLLNQPLAPARPVAAKPAAVQPHLQPATLSQALASAELRPAARVEPLPARRSRAVVDDDLFELTTADRRAPMAAMAGGRR